MLTRSDFFISKHVAFRIPLNSFLDDVNIYVCSAGTWVEKFELKPDLMDFTKRDGTWVKRKFMTKTSYKFKFHQTKDLRMVLIPYKEAQCYMVVAIPKDEKKHIGQYLVTLKIVVSVQDCAFSLPYN